MININKYIKIRKIKIEDAQDVFEYASNPLIVKCLTYPTHKSIDDTKNAINDIFLKDKNKFSYLGIEYKGKIIGSASIDLKNGFNLLGYQLNDKYWGKGIVTTCIPILISAFFDEYPNDKVYVSAEALNIKSWSIISKFGFVKQIIPASEAYNFNGIKGDKSYWLFAHTKQSWNNYLLRKNK